MNNDNNDNKRKHQVQVIDLSNDGEVVDLTVISTFKRQACSSQEQQEQQEEDEEPDEEEAETSCCGQCGTEYNVAKERACENRMDACRRCYLQARRDNKGRYNMLLKEYNKKK